MLLPRVYYGTRSSHVQGFSRSQGIPIEKEEVFAIHDIVKKHYRANWISGLGIATDTERYLINGGVVSFHDETIGLIHETQEGLEALTKHFNLPIPVTAPVGANTSSEII